MPTHLIPALPGVCPPCGRWPPRSVLSESDRAARPVALVLAVDSDHTGQPNQGGDDRSSAKRSRGRRLAGRRSGRLQSRHSHVACVWERDGPALVAQLRNQRRSLRV